jgi:hypothetical protein
VQKRAYVVLEAATPHLRTFADDLALERALRDHIETTHADGSEEVL